MIIVKNDIDLDEDEKLEIQKMNRIFFPENLTNNSYIFPKYREPCFRLLNKQNKRIVSHLLVVEREIQLHSVIKVASIGEVATLPNYQKRGYATQLFQYLSTILHEKHFDIGILCCEPTMKDFYSHLGWSILENPQIKIGASIMKSRCVDGLVFKLDLRKISNQNLQVLREEEIFLGEPP